MQIARHFVGRSNLSTIVVAVAACVLSSDLALAQPPVIALGEKLFKDSRLSANGLVSCASCHAPNKAFADGRSLSNGLHQQKSTRNAPSLLNVREHDSFFWDGRRARLEDQALDPFVNAGEHGLRDLEHLVDLVRRGPGYPREFAEAFPRDEISPKTIGLAIADYLRSLSAGPSRFDRYWQEGQRSALKESERRGFEIFRGPGKCASCHSIGEKHSTFTDNRFHSIGTSFAKWGDTLGDITKRALHATDQERFLLITNDPAIAALGRFNVTRKPADIGKYRTPSLRNVAATAPYMHDGSVKTLEEAVEQEIYYRSAEQGRPLILTPQEKANLVAFLRALTSESLEKKQGPQ